MGLSPDRVKQKTKKIGIYCFSALAHSIKEKENRLVGLESG
jgi:hypothetical protein